VKLAIAEAIGRDPASILVHTTLAGGGFGRRAFADWAAQAAVIASHIGRPVQLIWSRESDMTQGYYRPQTSIAMRGATTAGKVVALDAHVVGQPISVTMGSTFEAFMSAVPGPFRGTMAKSLASVMGSNTVPDMFATEGLADLDYAIGALRIAYTPVTTKVPVCWWRAVGHGFNAFALESFLDELARGAGVDTIELRRRMLPEGGRGRRVMDAVAKLARWPERATANVGRGFARHESFGSDVAQVAEVIVEDGRIRVKRVFVAVECGTIVNPDVVRAQIEGAIVFGLSAALAQEVTLKDGRVQQTNFDTYPLLRMNECPEIVVELLPSDAPPGGIGEPGLPPIAAAVANAIFDATGVRLRRLPLQRAWTEATR
jgi:CO/xanthine dehydrogenase Mo-binding subunit